MFWNEKEYFPGKSNYPEPNKQAILITVHFCFVNPFSHKCKILILCTCQWPNGCRIHKFLLLWILHSEV